MKNFKARLSLMTVSSLLLSSCTTYQRGMRTPSSNDDVYKTVSRKLVIQKIHPLAPKADPFYTVYSGISGIPVQVEVSDASNLDCKILGTTDDAEVETPSDVRGGSHYFNVSDNQQVRCQVRPDSTDVAIETEIKYHMVRQTLPVDDNTEISLNEELLRLKALLQDKKQLSTADFISMTKNGVVDQDKTTWTIDPNVGAKDLGVIGDNSIIVISSVAGNVEFPKSYNPFSKKISETGPEGKAVSLDSKEKTALPYADEKPYSIVCTFQKMEANQVIAFRGSTPSTTVIEGPGAVRCGFNIPKSTSLKGFFEVSGYSLKRDKLIVAADAALGNLKGVQDGREVNFNDAKVEALGQVLDKLVKDSAVKASFDKTTYEFWASKESEVEAYKKEAEKKAASAQDDADKKIQLSKDESARDLENAKAEGEYKVYLAKASKYFDDKISASQNPVGFEYSLNVVSVGLKAVAGVEIKGQQELYTGVNSRGQKIVLLNPVAKLGDSKLQDENGSTILTSRLYNSAFNTLKPKKMLVCSEVAKKLSSVAISQKGKIYKDVGEIINEKGIVKGNDKVSGLSFKTKPLGLNQKDLTGCQKEEEVEFTRIEKYKFCFAPGKDASFAPQSIQAAYQSAGQIIWLPVGSESGHPFFKQTSFQNASIGHEDNCVSSDNLFPDFK